MSVLEVKINTVHLCERCGGKLDIRPTVRSAGSTERESTIYASVRVDLCDSCIKDRDSLIRDLWLALPWQKREEFDSPLLDELERRIAIEQQGRLSA